MDSEEEGAQLQDTPLETPRDVSPLAENSEEFSLRAPPDYNEVIQETRNPIPSEQDPDQENNLNRSIENNPHESSSPEVLPLIVPQPKVIQVKESTLESPPESGTNQPSSLADGPKQDNDFVEIAEIASNSLRSLDKRRDSDELSEVIAER